MVDNYIGLSKEYLKLAFSTALEYRASVITQVVSMVFNDSFFLLFWVLFFTKFPTVVGWNWNDILLLQAAITLAFGLSGFFFGNRLEIAHIIAHGKLDYYLTLPKNVLYHLLVSKFSWYDVGDVVFGVIMACIAVNLSNLGLFVVLVLLSTLIYTSFAVIIGSLAFFLGNTEELSRSSMFGLIGLSSYPLPMYRGITKLILLTIIPAGFITGVPVELMRGFNWHWFLLMVGFTLVIIAIAIGIFYFGLRRYESGNLLYVRI